MKVKPGKVEFADFKATIKAVGDGDGPGEFEAILSTEALDRDGESVAAGALAPLPESIPIFHQHDWRDGALPVAKAVPFYDGETLKAKGTFASTDRGQEIRALVTEGIVDSMSIGFLNGKRATVGGQKSVVKAELFEASFTAIPINTQARVLAAKALDVKAGARNSGADSDRLQQIHDLAVENGADCSMTKSIKAIVGTVEALQSRVRDALEDAYGNWATYLRGVDPDQMLVYFDWYAGDGDTYQQSYGDDGAVVTLEGAAVEVDVHEVVVPDADADREAGEAGPTMLSKTKSTAEAAGKAAAPDGAAATPAAEAAEDEEAIAIRAQLLAIDALTAAAL